ncbi:MAG: DNA-directed RNA polymerase subunit beta', partial [Lactobacillaceae bacterium]|nr:DNA-directed RNA polymerase subunit beta' [Lactobacillaceae bacterium]
GDLIKRGEALNEGPIDPKELLEITDSLTTQNYLLSEIQKVYRLQGIEVNDKHIEVMVRQMLQKVRVMDPGDTSLLPGELIDIADFRRANEPALVGGLTPATARPVLLGISKASLETNSWLSAASFQETTKVLTDAAIRGKNDPLVGLKENVIIGKIIPAGTGVAEYRQVEEEVVAPAVGVITKPLTLDEMAAQNNWDAE